MKIRIGYVATSLTLNTTYSKTITYTNYQKLTKKEKKAKLENIINNNLDTLYDTLKFNIENDVTFYRISHNLIPLATHPKVKFNYYKPYKIKFDLIGKYINDNNIRIDAHPEEFCVLNSINSDVVKESIAILKYNQKIFNYLSVPAKLILHIGSSFPNKEEALTRFENNFLKLSKSLQKMIIIENDDRIFNIVDTLKLSQKLKVPMVLDYLHYKCNNNHEKLEDYLEAIFATWKNTNLNPKIHFSSSKNSKKKRHHSDFINYNDFIKFLFLLKPLNQDVDIMLECKMKDIALFTLIRKLKHDGFKFIDNTTFIL